MLRSFVSFLGIQTILMAASLSGICGQSDEIDKEDSRHFSSPKQSRFIALKDNSASPNSTQAQWAKRLALDSELNNSINMKLVLIPPGEFLMGSKKSANELAETFKADHLKPEWFESEYPQHRVRITKAFYLGTCEVTIGQFRRFVEKTNYKTEMEQIRNPEASQVWHNVPPNSDENHPVAMITWNDATAFCNWLSRQENKVYRLPTEAEWEYACKAESDTLYSFGDDLNLLKDYAWFAKESGVYPAAVAKKKPNNWGLYDMHGNVWEWCADWHAQDDYPKSSLENPTGAKSGTQRIIRGGSFNESAFNLRSANRNWFNPNETTYIGFRVVMEFPSKSDLKNQTDEK